jgi:cardiolipin synthase
MRYHFYTTSEKAWKGMLSAITGAKKSIYLEMYIFQNDTTGYDFLSELEKKASEGVLVIIILDAFGSYGLDSSVTERLRKVGAEVLFASFWFRRLHRKILIIDDTVGFVGGVNISGRFARWKDLEVRIQGKIVRTLLRSFTQMYGECGGKNLIFQDTEHPRVFTSARLWLVEHGIGGKRHSLRKHYEKHIDEAKHSIILVTPYLVPHRWLIARLHQAILRGVHVEIMVPEHTDHKIIDNINYHYLRLFSELGAKCFLSREMNHSKAMLVDSRVGTIGSHNLDSLSFNWNAEVGVFFENPSMVRKLCQILEIWKKTATPFDPKAHPSGRINAFLALILRMF